MNMAKVHIYPVFTQYFPMRGLTYSSAPSFGGRHCYFCFSGGRLRPRDGRELPKDLRGGRSEGTDTVCGSSHALCGKALPAALLAAG